MNRSLVRRTLGLVLGMALLAAFAANGPARAQDLKDIKGTVAEFETKDGAKLQGTFFAGKDKDQPTVLMLHKLKSDSSQGAWIEFAKRLNAAGYSVLTFDFRGHGDSKKVDDDYFWKSAHNVKYLPAYDKNKKLRDQIDHAEFPSGYYPYLINDIAAAKLYLDKQNDLNKCNSRALIVLGAEDGATLGAIWMASEWDRFAAGELYDTFGRFFPQKIATEPEGKAQYCAIWLNMKTDLVGKLSVRESLRVCIDRVGGYGEKKGKIPMWFICGATDKDDVDTQAVKTSMDLLKLLKGSDPTKSKLKYTALKRIVGKVDGADLLDNKLGTGEAILKEYLEKMSADKDFKPSDYDNTHPSTAPSVWLFPTLRLPVIAKTEKGKMEQIPLARYGLNP